MQSFSTTTTLAEEPSWCAGHLGSGPEATHVSAETRVETTSPFSPAERAEVYVGLEQPLGADLAAVRLSGAADAPMHPLQALQIGSALIAAALAALTGREATR